MTFGPSSSISPCQRRTRRGSHPFVPPITPASRPTSRARPDWPAGRLVRPAARSPHFVRPPSSSQSTGRTCEARVDRSPRRTLGAAPKVSVREPSIRPATRRPPPPPPTSTGRAALPGRTRRSEGPIRPRRSPSSAPGDRPAAGTTSATCTSPMAGTPPRRDRAPARPRTESVDTRGPEGRHGRGRAPACDLAASGPRRGHPTKVRRGARSTPHSALLQPRSQPRRSRRARRAGRPGSTRPPEAAAPRARQSAQNCPSSTPHPFPRWRRILYAPGTSLKQSEAFTGGRGACGSHRGSRGAVCEARPRSRALHLHLGFEMCQTSASGAGWSRLAARRAHNPKVAGSNPAPATKSRPALRSAGCRPSHFGCRFRPEQNPLPKLMWRTSPSRERWFDGARRRKRRRSSDRRQPETTARRAAGTPSISTTPSSPCHTCPP